MIRLATWWEAVTTMPRYDAETWRRLDPFAKWLVSVRATVLVLTLASAGLGGVLAWREGAFAWGPWLVTTLGLLLAHATNNLLNDLTDYLKGVDRDNYFRTAYGVQPLEAGYMRPRQSLALAAATGGLALACGAYLVALRGWPVVWLTLAGAFFVLFYTYPLKYVGLGEPAVWVVWGPLMVGGTYLVVTGRLSWEAVVAGGVYALGPTAVLFGKHIDKLEADRAKGIRTLPVLLGEARARRWVLAMLVLQHLGIAALVLSGRFGPALAVALAGLWWFRIVWRVYREPRPEAPPPELPEGIWPMWYVAAAFWYARRQGLLLLAAFVLEAALHRM